MIIKMKNLLNHKITIYKKFKSIKIFFIHLHELVHYECFQRTTDY